MVLPAPSPEAIRAARHHANLSQAAACQLVSNAGEKAYRTWQRYEAAPGHPEHRAIPPGLWELFLLKTGQHPTHQLNPRRPAAPAQGLSHA